MVPLPSSPRPLSAISPYFVVVGDFNGDGIPDMATANEFGNTLTVLLGNGDGTFTLKSSPNVGKLPVCIAADDFNQDHILDLAVTNSADGTVTILLGKGNGTFTAQSSLGVGNETHAIVVGDFNNDGIPDLAVSSLQDSVLTVLMGNADGTFTVKSTPDVGFYIYSLAVGDFNGDGIVDLAAANFYDNTVTVLLGKGDGMFSTLSSPSVGNSPDFIATGDLNGDGIPDLAIVNARDDGTVTALLSQITMAATAELASVSVSGTGTHQVVADYSGDTHFSSSTSSAVTLLSAKTATSLNLSSSSNPSHYGKQITLTATLGPYSSENLTTDGEIVTFYYGRTTIGSAPLSSGVATLQIGSLPVGTDVLTAVYAGDNNFTAATSAPLNQIVSPIRGLLVTVNTDNTTGVPSNCTSAGSTNCSLRDALAVAAAKGGGNITFSSTAFATPQTITLGSAGALNIPSNTTITGPTKSSVPNQVNLVTINGATNGVGPIFGIDASVINAEITGLNIMGGSTSGQLGGSSPIGGGINNDGTLTVTNSNVSGNGTEFLPGGGGINNSGTLTLMNSIVSGNGANLTFYPAVCYGGGGILNSGSMTVTNSTISGNIAFQCIFGGGGIFNTGTMMLRNSTITGNQDTNGPPLQGPPIQSSGAGILNQGSMTIANTIVADNVFYTATSTTYSSQEDDCDGPGCPANGTAGNLLGAGLSSTLPGSAAICAGLLANIPVGLMTDQRGVPRTTAYGKTNYVDSGAIETHYSLNFALEPPVSIGSKTNFKAAVQLKESNNPFRVSGIIIPIAMGPGSPGSLSGSASSTNGNGVTTYSNLSISEPGSSDILVATLPLSTTPPPAPLTTPVSIDATSTAFDVGQTGQTITFTPPISPVMYGAKPISLTATATSGLPVAFSVLSGPGMVNGRILTITGVGTITVAANQSGNADYAAAPQVTQRVGVNTAATTLTLSAAPANPAYGAPVTFTGIITPVPAGATASLFSFLVNPNTPSSVVLPVTTYQNGAVTIIYDQLRAGSHSVLLTFRGTADYAAATSAAVPVNVQQAMPAITWAPANAIRYGIPAAALLVATTNTPGGFSYAAQAAGGSTIELTAATVLAVGSYTLTASFTPTDIIDYKAATRAALLTVAQATLTVSANNATRVYGTANPAFTGSFTGAVNGDTFTENFATAAAINSDAGTYAIMPSVSGSNLADYAVTIKNGTLAVTPAASAMTLASSTLNSNLNESVTFTATVRSSTTGTPAGPVEFLNRSIVLGNSILNAQGVATYATSALAAGMQTISAVYAGDVDFAGSQAMLSQTVTAPDFSLNANPASLSLSQGETGLIKITLTPVGGYNGSLTFDCTGLPERASCTINPATLGTDGSNTAVSTTLTITTTGSNYGTVSQSAPNTPPSRATSPLLCSLPAGLLSFVLYLQRKRLSPTAKLVLWMTTLVAAISGIVACGSSPVTPTGSSIITVTAQGSGSNSQSVTVMVTITK